MSNTKILGEKVIFVVLEINIKVQSLIWRLSWLSLSLVIISREKGRGGKGTWVNHNEK